MKEILKAEQHVHDFAYKFVEENWDKIDLKLAEINQSKEDFLKEIKKDLETACWVLMEVADWAMEGVSKQDWLVGETEDGWNVYKLGDQHLIFWVDDYHNPYQVRFVYETKKAITVWA